MSKIPQSTKQLKDISPPQPPPLHIKISFEADQILERLKYELRTEVRRRVTKQEIVEMAIREFAKVPENKRQTRAARFASTPVLDSATAAG